MFIGLVRPRFGKDILHMRLYLHLNCGKWKKNVVTTDEATMYYTVDVVFVTIGLMRQT
jgi:hypothetical protein